MLHVLLQWWHAVQVSVDLCANLTDILSWYVHTSHAYALRYAWPCRHCTWRCAESNDTIIQRVETIVRDDFYGDHLDLGLVISRILTVVNKRTEVITAFKTHPGSDERRNEGKTLGASWFYAVIRLNHCAWKVAYVPQSTVTFGCCFSYFWDK